MIKIGGKYIIYYFNFSVSVKNNHPYPVVKNQGFSSVLSIPHYQKNMYFLALWFWCII